MIWISIYFGIGLGFGVATLEDSARGWSDFSMHKTFFLYCLAWPWMGIRNAWQKAEHNILDFVPILAGECLIIVFFGWAIIGIPFVWIMTGGPAQIREILKWRKEQVKGQKDE